MASRLRFKVSSSRFKLGVHGSKSEETEEDRPKSKKTKAEKRRIRKRNEIEKVDHSNDRVKK